MTADYRRYFLLLMIAAAVILAAGLGFRDPWPADEPRFALIARDMAEGGGWLLPKVGGVLYPDKPPLHFWIVASIYAITGSLRVSFLLPSLIGGLAVLAMVTDLGRRLWGDKVGLWSGAILLCMLQFPLQMKSGQLDGPLCFWTTLSLYGLSRHLLLGPDWRWYAIGGLAAGCGVITKGVGILPYLVLIPWGLAVSRGWELPRLGGWNRKWLLAPALTLLAIALWLVPMLIATSGDDPARLAYRNNILFHQTVTRYADSWGHIKPPWYLWTNALWLWLPATAVLPWLVAAWWRDLRAGRNAALLVLGGWVVLELLFFSMSSGKRSVYIFPAAPAFALIVAAYADTLATRAGVKRVLVALAVFLGLLVAAVGLYGLMNPQKIVEYVADAALAFRLAVSLLAVGVFMVATAMLFAWRRPLLGIAAALAILWLGLSLILAPALTDIRSGKALIRDAVAALAPSHSLGMVDWTEQFLLYLPREVTHFGYRREREGEVRDAISWLRADRNRRVLTSARQFRDCLPDNPPEPVGFAHRRDWLLLGWDDVRPQCREGAPAEPEMLYRYEPPGGR